ncbi:NAD(P)-binding protein [Polychaeton citri CBS 116435]|uniref:NAD(P)-binding protein n=1 Tax=Polychaeton citri CBS 116435 TaxID=1314669 RepID=A0A9P4QHB8_9PEZI|nr:NAD(P)-binding protein [Polychaeton citri CBS 116435]
MNKDWGFNNAGAFISKKHSEIYPAIDPRNLALPNAGENMPFNVCVVGASRGIGAGIAAAYAQAGATGLILASRRISGLEETAKRCRDIAKQPSDLKVEIVSCDITKPADVEGLAAKASELLGGRLDVVVLNSGTSGEVRLKLHEVPVDEFVHTTSVNYLGTFYVAKYFVPMLLSSMKANKGVGGEFMIVSSWASLIVRGPIANAQYCLSKMAQLKLAENLHEEYSEEGLNVYAVHPGAVATEIALETSPENFKEFLTDSPDLCGAFMVWISSTSSAFGQNVLRKDWLSGRFVDAKWDVEELEGKREELGDGDSLKLRMLV